MSTWAARELAAASTGLLLRDRSRGSRLAAECGRCGLDAVVFTGEVATAVVALRGYGWVRATGHDSEGWLCGECRLSTVRT